MDSTTAQHRVEVYQDPPTTPLNSEEYTDAGLPWCDYYGADTRALKGAEERAGVNTVKEMGMKKGEHPLPENESLLPDNIV